MAKKVTGMIKLLKFLASPRSLTEIAEHIGISERGVFRYLRDLKNAGVNILVLGGKKGGGKASYSLFPQNPKMINVSVMYGGGEGVTSQDQDFLVIPLKK